MELTSTREGGRPLPGAKPGAEKTQMTIAAKRLGACEAGQKPGDIISNGMTMNILDMQKGVPPKGGPPRRPQ
jgi:hypothetical protein